MDIVFNCPNCEQELAVDSSGAGSDIECPSCHETITIPAQSTRTAAPVEVPGLAASPIATSAAAKVEKHLKVPVLDKPAERLIVKATPVLESVQRGAGKRIIQRTIRHAQCVESGHDLFDEKVTVILNEIGEANIVGVHTIGYEHFDVGTQKVLTDFGVLIVYRG